MRQYRERRGITLDSLSDELSIHKGILSRVERGERRPPDLVPHVLHMCELFGLKPNSQAFREFVNLAYRDRYQEEGIEPYRAVLSLQAAGLDHPPQMPLFPGNTAPSPADQPTAETEEPPQFGYISRDVAHVLMQISGLVALYGAEKITVRTLDGKEHDFEFVLTEVSERKTA